LTGPLSLRRSANVAARVADVLAAAHRRGIIHRDIKPDNVFLHQDEGGEVVKVVDFGIAKFFTGPQSAEEQRLTRTGEYLGTPRFAAPERIFGGPDDGRSDVYSLGAVLYELICGVSPWTLDLQRQMAAGMSLDVPPRPMTRFRRDIPQALESLVCQMLDKE